MPSRLIALVFVLWFVAHPATAENMPQIPAAKSERIFAHPHDVELSPDGKHLYVADLDNDRVAVLDARTLKLVSTIGEKELSSPHDLTFAPDGRLLVADTANDRIAVYTISPGADGKPVGKLTTSWNSGMAGPEGVAINAKGDVFVGNTGWGSVVIVRRGRAVGALAEPASGKGAFRSPHDVMLARDGRMFVVDSGNHRIVVLGKDLKLSQILTGPPYDFKDPKYL
ncbi:MAG: beta-propeller fold lactonase family protein, partial [Rhodospirillaceae bacterium]|nr:beta-propeller fold lactonase family protein [Rhodospirillaceae bacterium]